MTEKKEATSTALAKMVGIDTKLSPAQVIDLVMDEMVDEVEDELKAAEKKLEKLEARTFTIDQVVHLMRKQKFTLNASHGYGKNAGKYEVCLQEDYNDNHGDERVAFDDKVLGAHAQELCECQMRVDALREQKQAIDGNKRAFRATVMKRVLEGTAEGRNVMAQIKSLKLQVREQLIKKAGK